MKISHKQMKELVETDITIIGIISGDTVRAYRSYVKLSDGAIVCIDWDCIMGEVGAKLQVSGYSFFQDIGRFAVESNLIDFIAYNGLIGGELAEYASNLDRSSDRKNYISAHVNSFEVFFDKVTFIKIW